MNKKNIYSENGISLITLVVTIMVMLILIGVVGKYSLDTIDESRDSVNTREIANVREYVLGQQMRLIGGEFEFDSSYSNKILTPDLAYVICSGKLTENEINNMIDVNAANIDIKYKYFYLPVSEKLFESTKFSGGNITVQDVANDYIVNFYTGTFICLTNETAKVEGIIKGLGEILIEIES